MWEQALGTLAKMVYTIWFLGPENADPRARLLGNLAAFCAGLDDEGANFTAACQ